MRRVMIIRHAEKHTDGGGEHGVNLQGVHTKHELTVRGWQRAGALVPYFAPPGGWPAGAPLSTPVSIFASAPTHDSPSLRALHTVHPLAAMLGVEVEAGYGEGQEAAAALAVLAAPGPVLIAWHHSHIPPLARAIAGDDLACPAHWPDERFDVVWVLDQDAPGGRWRVAQLAQRLFAGDRADTF